MGVHCLFLAKMLLPILLLNLIFSQVGADEKLAPKQSLENLVEQLELRLREMELRHEKEKKELETKDKEMEARLRELEEKMKEGKGEFQKKGGEETSSNLRIEAEGESIGKEMASKNSNHTLANPSLRDLPIVLISAWNGQILRSPRTVTFDSFLVNFNNADKPGGGDGVLDLDSGVFTCFTPGYYTISFSAHAVVGPDHANAYLYLLKNGALLPESKWYVAANSGLNDDIGVTSSRILILHLDAGETLELRMTQGDYIKEITLNIELIGLGFDYLV